MILQQELSESWQYFSEEDKHTDWVLVLVVELLLAGSNGRLIRSGQAKQ